MEPDALNYIKDQVQRLTDLVDLTSNRTGLDLPNSLDDKQLQEVTAELLPKLLAVTKAALEHLTRLEGQSRMHRQQAHRFRMDGHAQMSVRATHLANHDDRMQGLLADEFVKAWNAAGEQPVKKC